MATLRCLIEQELELFRNLLDLDCLALVSAHGKLLGVAGSVSGDWRDICAGVASLEHVGAGLASNEPVVILDDAMPEALRRSLDALNVGACLAVRIEQECLTARWLVMGRIERVVWSRADVERLGRCVEAIIGRLEERNREWRTASEAELRASRVFNNIPALYIVMDRVGRVKAINERALDRLGCNRRSVVGGRCASLMTESSASVLKRLIHPRLMQKGRVDDQRIDFVSASGEVVAVKLDAWVENDSHGRPFEIHCVANDVSRHIVALQDIERRRQRFEAIVQDQTDLISRYLPDGTLTFVNDSYCRFFDADEVDLLGRSVFALWSDKAARDLRKGLATLAAGQSISGEYCFPSSAGNLWLHSTDRAIIDQSGTIVEYQAVARDVTEARRNHRLLAESERRLGQIIDQLFVFVAILSPEGELIEINRAPLQLADIGRTAAVGKMIWKGPWWQQCEETVVRLKTATKTAAAGEPLRFDAEVALDGKPAMVMDFQIAPLRDQDGRVTELVASGVDITARKIAEQRFEHLAMHDGLTGLPNRSLFRISLERENERLGRHGGFLAVISVDLDHFKDVNDNFGHAVGDGLLKQVARRLQVSIRKSDFLARLGGDEFAVIVSPGERRADLEVLARRIVTSINHPFEVDGQEVRIGVSLGIAETDEACNDIEELLNRSDMALYAVKETGRGSWQYYRPALSEHHRTKRRIAHELEAAVRGNELDLHYQPILSADDLNLIGLEGLIRWNHPERGIIEPGSFMQFVESHGMLRAIRCWVLRRALTQHRSWRMAGLLDVPVSINLGRFNMPEVDSVFSDIVSIVDEIGGRSEDLMLDFTESDLAQGGAVTSLIGDLKNCGIGVAIDDFGTGGTSLARLGHLRAAQLKIDGSLLLSDERGFDPVSIIGAIVNIASANGMITVLEAVETEEQLSIARLAGCSAVQGYHIKRPSTPAEIESWLALQPHQSGRTMVRH